MIGKVNIRISPSKSTLPMAEEIIRAISESAAADSRKAFHLRLIMSELVTNAYLHGFYPRSDDFIEFQADFNRQKFSFSIINRGAFPDDINMEQLDFPRTAEESGRGLRIVRRLCSEFKVNTLPNNRLEIRVKFDLETENDVKTIK